MSRPTIPASHPVQPCDPSHPGAATCHTCGLSWRDDISTGLTPAPGGRCPFEHFHLPEPIQSNPWYELLSASRILSTESTAEAHGRWLDAIEALDDVQV